MATLVDLRLVVEAIRVDEVELAEEEREVVELREGTSVRVELWAVEVSVAVVVVTVELAEESVEDGRDEFVALVEAMRVGRCLPVVADEDAVLFFDAVCTACRRPVALLATVALAGAFGIPANPPVFAGRTPPVSTAKPAPTPMLPSKDTVAFRPSRGRVALEALVWADEGERVEFCAE